MSDCLLKYTELVKNLTDGEECRINWYSDGGIIIRRVVDELLMYEIPMYGGDENFMGCFSVLEYEKVARLARDCA